jgi:hypothetical protein
MEISRKELFDHIWKTPRTELAPIWKVKASEITKACNGHKIPLPAAGHWTKINTGHVVNVPILSGDFNTIVKIIPASNRLKPKAEFIEPKLEKEKRTTLLPECRKALKIYSAKGQQKHYQYDYIWPYKEEVLRIGVMSETIKRAISLFDMLLREFKKNKWVYELPSISNNQVNTVIINDERIDFVLKEMRRQEKIKTDDSWRQYQFIFHATGNIRIQYGRSGCMYSEIKDKKSIRLEEQIQHVSNAFLNVSDSIKKSRQARIDSEHQESLKYTLKNLVKDVVDYNQSCESNIFELLDKFEKSKRIISLANHIEENWSQNNVNQKEQIWIEFLKAKANEIDPAKMRNSILLNTPQDIEMYVLEKIKEEPKRYGELSSLNIQSEIKKILHWNSVMGKYS